MGTAGFLTIDLQCDDVVYSPLPAYHLSLGVMTVGLALCHGCSVVLAKKFSASRYFDDCVRYRATVCVVYGIMFCVSSVCF